MSTHDNTAPLIEGLIEEGEALTRVNAEPKAKPRPPEEAVGKETVPAKEPGPGPNLGSSRGKLPQFAGISWVRGGRGKEKWPTSEDAAI
jgi:hypothetical protein